MSHLVNNLIFLAQLLKHMVRILNHRRLLWFFLVCHDAAFFILINYFITSQYPPLFAPTLFILFCSLSSLIIFCTVLVPSLHITESCLIVIYLSFFIASIISCAFCCAFCCVLFGIFSFSTSFSVSNITSSIYSINGVLSP